MAGYRGICNQYYDCHYREHEIECEGKPKSTVVGSEKDFIQQHGNYPPNIQEEIWNKHYKTYR